MIWICLGLAIGIVGSWFDAEDPVDIIGRSVAGGFGGALIGAIIALFAGLAVYGSDYYTVKTDPIPLESLVDGSDTRGTFFLGTGTIDDVSTFTWYEQTEENSYRQAQADASDSTVHFIDEDEEPYYVITQKANKEREFLSFWGFSLVEGVDNHFNEYDFYVPEGTIQHNYELDAE